MARLIFHLGNGRTLDFNLTAAVVTLGRSTSNDIVINNGWISSQHAKFERSGGSIEVMNLGTLHGIPLKEFKRVGGVYTVVDLDSHNGVMVNGKKVSSQRLNPGDRLTFGQLEAVFEETPDSAGKAPGEVLESVRGRAPEVAEVAAAAREDRPPAPEVRPPALPAAADSAPARPVMRLADVPIGVAPVLAAAGPAPVSPPSPPVPPVPPPASPPVPVPPPKSNGPLPDPEPWVVEAVAPVAPVAPVASMAAFKGAEPERQSDALPAAAATLPSPARPAPPAADIARSDRHQTTRVETEPVSARTALASLQRDVALLEKTLGALQVGKEEGPPEEQTLACGLIQRIDQLEDLMMAGESSLPGFAQRLEPLHASLLQLLRDHGIERYTVPPGQPLDIATRRRITIVAAAPEGEGITEIAEVFRAGYHSVAAIGSGPAAIVRKAEVSTVRRLAVQSH